MEVRFASGADDGALIGEIASRFGVTLPFGSNAGAPVRIAHCPEARLYDLVSFLYAEGRETVTAARADYVFEARNPLRERLLEKLNSRN